MTVGVVVPTLGTRGSLLKQCLESIRKSAKSTTIVIVSPEMPIIQDLRNNGLCDDWILDPGKGLSGAINAGMERLSGIAEYASWLGDDDLLDPGSLETLANQLQTSGASFVFSGCRYIDENNATVWVNRSGGWALKSLGYGPDLIPQPASLFRLEDFWSVGGVDENLGWAFDLDMFLKLRDFGGGMYFPGVIASFRWHSNSLSVGLRMKSVIEAAKVKSRRMPQISRPFFWPIHFLVAVAVFFAGKKIRLLPRIGRVSQ